ncbi:glycosyltransferase [Cellulomonas telluris]|uniref:glycosyltransferase n=1 Tax=Cellulomonas telluris TaxID=2306636 RepID=UPI001FE5A410|nr:glycosyltransferase [Cellulomonas telluris]
MTTAAHVPVSVCMATYNGEAWVAEQVASVLAQLGPDDELVVVDDASQDGTVAALRALGDPRVRIEVQQANRGYVRTFEHALRLARGEHVVLADQDDVWVEGRLAAMTAALDAGADVVATNLATLDGPDAIRGPYGQADWHLRAAHSRRRLRNVVGVLAGNRPYYGCAMALRRSALSTVLPFPGFLEESHDLWIALYGNVLGRMRHLELRSVRRRFHGDNASPDRPRGLRLVLRSRFMLVRAVLELVRRGRARA